MATSYTRKSIRVVVDLGNGYVKTIEGLAVKAQISKLGLPDKNKASLSIKGLSYDDMAALTTISYGPLRMRRNAISVYAGEEGTTLPLVFKGNITRAWADFNTAPDVTMKFECMTGGFMSLMPQGPIAASGDAKAADMVGTFAKQAGFSFTNQGVDASVSNAVFSGSPVEKAVAVSQQVGADLIIDDDSMILLKKGDVRRNSGTVVISAETGMIGYPTFTNNGIQVKCFFNPAVQRGGLIDIQTIVPKASGQWRAVKIDHNITAFDPSGGPWETSIEGVHGSRWLAANI
jgi:hypothetical protein